MGDTNPEDASDAAAATTFVVGTRKSPLAIAQAEEAVSALQAIFPQCSFPIHSMTTTGDHDQNTALYNFGGKGLWTSQFEDKLARGELDLVVHSLKDMPTTLPSGCVLGCITQRADPRDSLVIKKQLADTHGWTCLSDLPAGSVIGSSSIRRIAQLTRLHPHLRFKDVRGNIHTRLAKLEADPDMAALVLAAAGLRRMNLHRRISQYLDNDSAGVLYAVGQGALGIECRKGDERVLTALRQLEHRPSALACLAERSLMRTLEGGCSVPIGVETQWVGQNLQLRASVVSPAGTEGVDAEATELVDSLACAEEFGKRVALDLVMRGANTILDAINANRSATETLASEGV